MEINEIHDISSFTNALHVDKTGARYYVKIRFKNIPLQSEFEEIESIGIKLLDYVPKNAYYCSIDTKAIKADLSKYRVVSIDTIALYEKINPELIDRVPDWMNSEEGYVKLNIDYFKGISDFSTIAESLTGIGAEILEHNEYFCKYYIRIKYDDIRRFASLPWVMYVDTDNKPLKTDNYVAGQSHTANALRLENSLGGRGLTGQGVKIGIFDDGKIGYHYDFGNRVFHNDNADYGEHATHCLGTIGGAGIIDIKGMGMAPVSELFAWSINVNGGIYLLETIHQAVQNYGITLNSNSYGYMAQSPCGFRGKYDACSRDVDKLTKDSISFLQIYAAGNDGLYCNGWNTVGDGYTISKNILTIGAIDKSDKIAYFSSRGPTHEGRIKPEITSVGYSVCSAIDSNSYRIWQGTSMATPGVTGTVALLYERYMQLNNGNKPDAALIKGIVCNTADDLGNIGPDYTFGYGKINGLRAVRIIEQGNYYSNNISQSNIQTQNVTIPANTGQLKVMLSWTDREALPNAMPAIVNNLDLMVTSNGVNYSPLVLDPANPAVVAVPGIDSLNVLELVTIDNPTAGNSVITVTGATVPFGPQKYYVTYEFVKKGIELTYPLAKDRITTNAEHILRWNSFGLIDSISIELSTNNGTSWALLSKIANNQNFYNWIPSGSQSTGQAKIRLTSGNYSFTMDSTFSIFPQPSGLALTTGDDESINMQWNSVANAVGYEILKLNNAYEWEIIDTTLLTTYNVAGLVDFNTYWLTVIALGNNGAKSQRLAAKSCQVITSFHTPQLQYPNDGLGEVSIAPVFKWINLRDAVNYQIQIASNRAFNNIEYEIFTSDSLFNSDSLNYSTEYFWRVRAIKQNDSTEWSHVWQFITTMDPALALEENSTGNTLWAWGNNNMAQLGFYDYSNPTLIGNKKWKMVSSNATNTFGIDSAGYLWAWGYGGRTGDSSWNQRNTPYKIGSQKWRKVSTQHAIREDGTLWGWGTNWIGQIGDGTQNDRTGIVQIGTDTSWADVSNGNNHTIAIKTDGSLWAWGDNSSRQLGDSLVASRPLPGRVGNQNNWVKISAGMWYNLAIKSDGSLWAWGNNYYAQLGDSTTQNSTLPKRIGNDNNWAAISAGKFTNHAIKTDGSLWAWGYNDLGQVGNNSNQERVLYPIRIGNENVWTFVSSGENHTIAVKIDGTAWTWGANNWNLINQSDSSVCCYPTRIPTPANVKFSACSGSQSFLITADSIVYSWGKNSWGQLGIVNTNYSQPRKLRYLTGIKDINASLCHGIAISRTKKGLVFGTNEDGYNNGIDAGQPLDPVLLNSNISVKKAFLGSQHNFIQTTENNWLVWGTNSYGCFGNGTSSSYTQRTPLQTELDRSFVSIALGDFFNVGIKGDGSMWTWGRNNYGQLGNGTLDYSNVPIQIGNEYAWRTVACGPSHVIAIRDNGTLWAWGRNNSGQLGDSSYTDKLQPVQIGNQNDWDTVACGADYSIGKKTDGTLWAWGGNNYGQLGNGTGFYRNFPVLIPNNANWKSVAAGRTHVIAIKEDGSLWAWGRNDYGQLGDSSTINRFSPVRIGNNSNWIKVSAGNATSFAIMEPTTFTTPVLLLPSDKATLQLKDTLFSWKSVGDAINYQLQISTDSTFSFILFDSITNDSSCNVSQLKENTRYFWRVRAMNQFDTTSWSLVQSFSYIDSRQQLIVLHQGDNLVSSYIQPTDYLLSNILYNVESKIFLVSCANNRYYMPYFGIMSLDSWNNNRSYEIYSAADAVVTLRGITIVPDSTNIPLQSGWNTIPYLRNTPMKAETALASILQFVQIVQNREGGQYVPSETINTLEAGTSNAGMLVPGKGYMIYVSQECTLTYPAN